MLSVIVLKNKKNKLTAANCPKNDVVKLAVIRSWLSKKEGWMSQSHRSRVAQNSTKIVGVSVFIFGKIREKSHSNDGNCDETLADGKINSIPTCPTMHLHTILEVFPVSQSGTFPPFDSYIIFPIKRNSQFGRSGKVGGAKNSG